MNASEIPVAHTPPDGWHGEMPAPVLAGCSEPLAPGAPDLRGTWRAYRAEQGGKEMRDHPIARHVERIEQCGDRVVITGGRIIHDMRADGVLEHGVDDVLEADLKTRIRVAARFHEGRLELFPGGTRDGVAPLVTRELTDEGEMLWRYGPFTVWLRRER